MASKHHKNNAVKHDLDKLKAILALTAKDMRGQALDAVTESLTSVKDKSSDIQGTVAHYVGDKPFKALGIAVLSGLLLGFAMRKRRRYHTHR
jgi:ElaB/YqjD/DUF883 family membrane-anchored ribosome-binding protein